MPPRKRTATKPSQATGDVSATEAAAAKKALDATKADFDAKETFIDDDETPIPDDLVFTTPKKEHPETEPDDENDVKEFRIDDQLCVAVRPDPGAWVLLIRSLGSSKTFIDRVEAIMSIVDNTFDDASKFYVHSRLMARGDDFDIEFLAKIVNKLVDEWTPQEGNRAQRRQLARTNAGR